MSEAGAPRPRRRWTARLLARLADFGESPRRTAAAIALGVFLSFSPFLGLQIALGMTAAFALRLNKAAVLIGLCANLPWIMIPWYVLTTAAAAAAAGGSLVSDLDDRLAAVLSQPIYRRVFWERTAELLGPYLWSYFIGSTVGALLLGATAYLLVRQFLERRRSP